MRTNTCYSRKWLRTEELKTKLGRLLEMGVVWEQVHHRVVERIFQVGDTVGSSVTNPARLE